LLNGPIALQFSDEGLPRILRAAKRNEAYLLGLYPGLCPLSQGLGPDLGLEETAKLTSRRGQAFHSTGLAWSLAILGCFSFDGG
jgi:hypothetical protein